jgi:flagellar P-ring protein precursor FlgI
MLIRIWTPLAITARVILFLLPCFTLVDRASAGARLKDIVTIEGVRENPLIGYGLVVGLNGTGDRRQTPPFASTTLPR